MLVRGTAHIAVKAKVTAHDDDADVVCARRLHTHTSSATPMLEDDEIGRREGSWTDTLGVLDLAQQCVQQGRAVQSLAIVSIQVQGAVLKKAEHYRTISHRQNRNGSVPFHGGFTCHNRTALNRGNAYENRRRPEAGADFGPSLDRPWEDFVENLTRFLPWG